MTKNQESTVIETRALCQENSRQIQTIVSQISSLVEKLDKKTQTNWPVIWSAIAVFVTVAGLIGGGTWVIVKNEIASVQKTTDSSESRLQLLENSIFRDKESKAKMWDEFVFQRITNVGTN